MATKKKVTKATTVQYPVRNAQGKEVGSVELDAKFFAAPLHEAVVFETVLWQRSRTRQGTHSCLTKGTMRGGGKKPWKQKGTGRARAGTNKSPLWVGGAVAHGPKSNPFGYEQRVAKRTRRQALAAALTDKVNNGGLVVLDQWTKTAGKTKQMAQVLGAVGASGKIVLLSTPGAESVGAGARNIEGLKVLPPQALNAFDVLRSKFIVGTKEQVLALQQALQDRGAE